MSPKPQEDSWSAWMNHVLSELDRLNGCSQKDKEEIVELKVELATIKVKSGIWGLLGAAIPVGILIAVKFLTE